MRDGWAADFRQVVADYWTPNRLGNLGDKRRLIAPTEAPILLRAMGLLNRDGSMPPAKVRKYRQINHMLSYLRPTLQGLLSDNTLRFVDVGCGRSYLSLLIAWWFERQGQKVQILGIDFKPKILQECERRAEAAGVQSGMRFIQANSNTISLNDTWKELFGEPIGELTAVVALHACDTATDDALFLGVKHQARFIAVSPCCQGELARSWKELEREPGALSPIWSTPHLRRQTAATLTDTFRMLLMRDAGYRCNAFEFVPTEHTPKNTLITAHIGHNNPNARPEFEALIQATGGCSIGLEARLLGLR